MEEISFSCFKVEILEKIKRLRANVLPRSKKAKMAATLEIRIQPQYVSLHITGGTEKLFCNTKGWGSFTLSLEYFYLILTDYSGTIFAPTFHDGEMQAGGLFTRGLGFKIQNAHPENKVTLDLPLNYTELDVLKLRNKPSEQLTIVNADALVESAEQKLEYRIGKAFQELKCYGVTSQEIKELVEKHL